jgi:DNA-binding response OmpR family regulator
MSKILTVDDDPTLLDTNRRILQQAGHEVSVEGSGLGALSRLRSLPFDVVLADLRLPDISGLDLLTLTRADRNPVAFVLLTGCGSSSTEAAALRLGADAYVEKPIFADALLNVVKAQAPASSFPCAGRRHSPASLETHAATRWASAVTSVLDTPDDPKTLAAWSRAAGASVGALRNWCRIARLSPRRSLLFARLLRAVVSSQGASWRPEQLLDVVDPRTLTRILRFAGLDRLADDTGGPDPLSFLTTQTLIRDPCALRAVRDLIVARPEGNE